MLCPNCAASLSATANFCPNCGTPIAQQAGSPYAEAQAQAQPQAEAQAEQSPFERGYQQGYEWATGTAAGAQQASSSDYASSQAYGQPAPPMAEGVVGQPKNRIAAGVLAILCGSLGIHKFYLGYTKEGIIMLLVTLLTFGIGATAMAVIGIVEGIFYLVKSDEEFYYTYEVGNKGWF